MKHLALAACAAGMLAAAPAHALEIRVDPAPIYVFDLSPERGGYDVVLHNILVVNDERRVREVRGLRVELLAGGEIVAVSRVPAAIVGRRAERMSALNQAGVLRMMDFQFHLSRLMHEGEQLSADATLEPGEAYLNSGLYAAAPSLPDAARVVAEGPRGDLGSVTVPVLRFQSASQYRAPLDGRWVVVASADAGHHHRWVVSSEYALDLIRVGADMRTYDGDGTRLENYATFGQPILAAADGVVVAARGDREDNQAMLRRPGEAFDAYMARVQEMQQAILMADGFEGAAGNYVLIRHEGGEHSLYAHMRQGSIAVAPGDVVRAGQRIGEAGSSGNSTEPHLHFQLIDGPDLNSARGLPVVFEGLREEWVPMRGRQLRAGDLIDPAS